MNNIRSSKNVPSFLSSNKSLLQKWKHNLPNLIRTAVLILIVSSCSTPTVWSYTPNSYIQSDRKILLKTVSIPPFRDKRPDKEENLIFLGAIPLMPYGWADYEKPENAEAHLTSKPWHNYRPTDDFAKALAEEVKKAGIILETPSELRKEDQYYIQGKIWKTGYYGKIFTYGLTSLGS
ncbi:MAG TPA: hypothetical protein PKK94_28765, partial [Leptospiraceae bacterium]|nr:hypothetical protein [Leptospiraceae bacterium]